MLARSTKEMHLDAAMEVDCRCSGREVVSTLFHTAEGGANGNAESSALLKSLFVHFNTRRQ